jgi:hypothetical protein
VWLTEQKCPERTRALLAQMAQGSGQATQGQDAAREYPRLVVAAQDHLANQTDLLRVDPQYLGFTEAGAGVYLAQYFNAKIALAKFK